MLFNSFDFALFFPIVTALYFALPFRFRASWLLFSSCVFYMDWIPAYILILFFIIAVDFISGQQIEASTGLRRKLFLLMSITANIGTLCLFKYYNFFVGNVEQLFHAFGVNAPLPLLSLILPIGLSFHTFQALSYIIEVYKGKQNAERNLIVYALYVMFYPQLVAGPIERPQHMLHQFKEEHRFDFDAFTKGLQLMLWGFFKKLVIADRLAVLVNSVYSHPHDFSGFPLMLATVAFAYQIYCDFSGYSDIAIGAAQAMGFRLMVNFRCPYSASSIRDFWQRWHISLSTWFRDYVYIPLGGSKQGEWKTYSNLLIVFLLSGLWHGANWTFVFWGFVHGLYMVVFLAWQRLKSLPAIPEAVRQTVAFLGLPLTYACAVFAWIFFRADSVSDAFWVAGHLLPVNSFELSTDLGLSPSEIWIAVCSVIVLELVQLIQRRTSVRNLIGRWPLSLRWPVYYTAIFTVVLLGKFSSQTFIYFQF